MCCGWSIEATMLVRTRLLVVIHEQLTQSHFPYHDSPQGAGAVFQGPTSSADPQGVGPAQNWYVVADGVNDKFHYEFGSKGEYGAPSQLDGHVPQVYATWVNGLTPGRYYARAWVFRYVQTGSTVQHSKNTASRSLRTSGLATSRYQWTCESAAGSTRQFTSTTTQEQLASSPISTGAQVLVGTLSTAQSGILYSYNQTLLCGTSLYPCHESPPLQILSYLTAAQKPINY